jgi:hypothetical protein
MDKRFSNRIEMGERKKEYVDRKLEISTRQSQAQRHHFKINFLPPSLFNSSNAHFQQ